MKPFLFLLPAVAMAQLPFSVGVKVGAPLTDAFNIARSGNFAADQKNLIIGPTAELKLPFGFGIEVDALYRRYEYSFQSISQVPGELLSAQRKSGSWQFPVLAKVRGGLPIVKPYAVGGVTFQKLTGLKQAIGCVGGNCTRSFSDVAHDTNIGLTLGAGLQISALLLKISPEVRFTRWGFANFDASALGNVLKSNQNQADFLVGFTF